MVEILSLLCAYRLPFTRYKENRCVPQGRDFKKQRHIFAQSMHVIDNGGLIIPPEMIQIVNL